MPYEGKAGVAIVCFFGAAPHTSRRTWCWVDPVVRQAINVMQREPRRRGAIVVEGARRRRGDAPDKYVATLTVRRQEPLRVPQ
jgi:hypothetical protein